MIDKGGHLPTIIFIITINQRQKKSQAKPLKIAKKNRSYTKLFNLQTIKRFHGAPLSQLNHISRKNIKT